MDAESLPRYLAGLPIPALRYLPSAGSTNDLALQWCEAGAPDGALVIADTQTAGRGRASGRRWLTPPGAALAFSLILRPTAGESQCTGRFSPLAALALTQILDKVYHLDAQIKWPNDVLVARRKLCGILVESAWLGDKLQAVVIGVGINIASSAVPPVNETLYPATSIQDELGHPIERQELLAEVLYTLFAWRPRLNGEDFFQAWEQYLAYRGEWVRIEENEQPPLTGVVLGLDRQGNLRLRLANGEEHSVVVGDVHLRLAE